MRLGIKNKPANFYMLSAFTIFARILYFRIRRSVRNILAIIICSLLAVSCSVTKFVPEGKYLLDDVKVISHIDEANAVSARGYLKQTPNSKWFGLLRVPLRIYSSSGRDSTKWVNKVLRRMGEPPVVYSTELSEQTRSNMVQMLQNNGYLHATVDYEYKVRNGKKAELTYYLHEKKKYYVRSIVYDIEDDSIAAILEADSKESLLSPGMPFNVDKLEGERRRITTLLRDKGYYKFQKDYITFVADTAHYSTDIDLTMRLALYTAGENAAPEPHKVYTYGNVYYVSGAGLRLDDELLAQCDTFNYGGYKFRYKESTVVRPKVLAHNTYLVPGEKYTAKNIDRTYSSLAQLTALRYPTLRLVEHPDTALLDCYIMYERNKRRSVSFEVEGTNTAGDLGAASSITFSDRNLFRGSELLSLRLYGAYEAITGLSGYTGDFFLEYGAELSLRLPGGFASRLLPVSERMLKSSTLLSLRLNSQERPEFDRRLLAASWSYQWSKNVRALHKLDLLDVNYIYVPWISSTFKSEYLDNVSSRNSILKYNYENLLITKLGYSFSYNSSYGSIRNMSNVAYSLRAGVECSGNVLNAASKLVGQQRNADGQYTFLDIAYAQYIKGDFDFVTRIKFDERNSLVMHLGAGIAYPYGNSNILPFEKRYFAGGANGLRGWNVRSVGPGRYKSRNEDIDFINQLGDMKLDFSLELRSHLFWKIQSAVFVDAGNVWTLRDYDEQPGGAFRLAHFWRDIAFAYGAGLRFEFDFFVFRLDAGMKAVNPAYKGKEKLAILSPDFDRDFALHFAIGYPF